MLATTLQLPIGHCYTVCAIMQIKLNTFCLTNADKSWIGVGYCIIWAILSEKLQQRKVVVGLFSFAQRSGKTCFYDWLRSFFFPTFLMFYKKVFVFFDRFKRSLFFFLLFLLGIFSLEMIPPTLPRWVSQGD